jgi:hypothetical protein
MLTKYYPKGLRKGMLIESGEYRNWKLLEMPLSPVPPDRKEWGTEPAKYEYYLDPLNLLEDIITTGSCLYFVTPLYNESFRHMLCA